MTQITPTAGARRTALRRVMPPGALPLATLIALVTVGWEHVYHTVAWASTRRWPATRSTSYEIPRWFGRSRSWRRRPACGSRVR
jgi:hypothetical protein